MLNIAPLDYERYAALYSPPPVFHKINAQASGPKQDVQESSPVSSEMRRRASALENKTRLVERTQDENLRVNNEKEIDHPLSGPFPTDIRTFVDLLNNDQTSSFIQRGLTPKFVSGLYQVQGEDAIGSLRIVA